MKTIVGVMGPGESATEHDIKLARKLGKAIAENGWVLLSGGRNSGVMDAVNQGAKEANGLTLAILPSKDKIDVSSAVDIAVATDMGSARNNINILTADAIVACGDAGAGTLSEIALAIKSDKPVILLSDNEAEHIYLLNKFPTMVSIATDVNDCIALVSKQLNA